VDGIHRVAAGEPILSPTVTAQLIASVAKPEDAERRADALRALEVLTPRERDVAVAVAEGLSNQEIAERLFLGLATVKTHVAHLFAPARTRCWSSSPTSSRRTGRTRSACGRPSAAPPSCTATASGSTGSPTS
jgi:DNA-binding NarL/FixJ family response regulator